MERHEGQGYLGVAKRVEGEDGERECEVEREDHGVERDVGLVDGVETEEPGSNVGRDREEQTLLIGARKKQSILCPYALAKLMCQLIEALALA